MKRYKRNEISSFPGRSSKSERRRHGAGDLDHSLSALLGALVVVVRDLNGVVVGIRKGIRFRRVLEVGEGLVGQGQVPVVAARIVQKLPHLGLEPGPETERVGTIKILVLQKPWLL